MFIAVFGYGYTHQQQCEVQYSIRSIYDLNHAGFDVRNSPFYLCNHLALHNSASRWHSCCRCLAFMLLFRPNPLIFYSWRKSTARWVRLLTLYDCSYLCRKNYLSPPRALSAPIPSSTNSAIIVRPCVTDGGFISIPTQYIRDRLIHLPLPSIG